MGGLVDFKPEKDIPSLEGKVIFVTGGTAGLGSVTIRALAKHEPEHIYFSGRNKKAGELLIAHIRETNPSVSLTFLEMDLCSLSSVKAASEKFAHKRLDILICNAGIMAAPPALSTDGYEIQFATNHLGHAMLIQQLLPIMLETTKIPEADVRIVCLSSDGWATHPKGGVQFSGLKTVQDRFLGPSIRYGQSKLANVVYAAELARRFPSITSVSIHPGVINTGLLQNAPLLSRALVYTLNKVNYLDVVTEEQGSLNSLYMAVGMHKTEVVNGGFYRPMGVLCNHKLDAVAKSEDFAKQLWVWTETALKGY
ncbi:putative oxidoreductase [Lachnellula hyalina]|uniref:Putative oxidoreductase n=1 Tax=Lachnellula hyalina TaxID=1316788 RepID=A0A8H8QTR3_9HELO|nr:putative oxidoreductase [Lachnellula hyalina]TVY22488.1 putative oxidoreductase [Lachnellula hyalina]